MANTNESHSVSIRKPTTETAGVLAFGDDCFRLGSDSGRGPNWKYEIPFSEIVQIEYKMVRDIMRGRLKDGTEFDFRFKSIANPAKAARQGIAINAALAKIPAGITDGGSLRTVGSRSSASGADPAEGRRPCATPGCSNDRTHGNFCATHGLDADTSSGCLGCLGSVLVATMSIMTILAVVV